jgi:hypothetical protein
MPRFVAEGQKADFLKSEARFLGLLGGIGSGKTATGAVKAIMKINAGEPGIIVGPDFPHFAKSTWPEFAKWCPWELCTNRHLDHPYTQKKMLEFRVNGKEVHVLYGGIEDPSSWTGPNVNWAWMDEGGRKKSRRAFDILAGRIRVGKNPQLWVTTSPAGVRHWLFEIFEQQAFPEETTKILKDLGFKGKLAEAFHCKTADNKKNLDPFYYASLMGIYAGKMRDQELDGEFITMGDRIWELFDPEHNVTDEADFTPGIPVEWWIDDGFTSQHPRVILFAQEVPPYVNVFDELLVTHELAEQTLQRAVTERPWPKARLAYCDSSAAELIARLWDADIDTIRASHKIEEGIKRVSPWILDGNGVAHLRFHPRCAQSIRAMLDYEYDEETHRLPLLGDDVPDVIRYGLWFRDREAVFKESTVLKPNAPPVVIERPRSRAEAREEAFKFYATRLTW